MMHLLAGVTDGLTFCCHGWYEVFWELVKAEILMMVRGVGMSACAGLVILGMG